MANPILVDLQKEIVSYFISNDAMDPLADTALSTKSVQSVSITVPGSGYSADFAVTFTGGGGTAAAGIAVVDGGEVIDVIITNGGSGYTSDPTPNFSAGSGTLAAGTASRLASIKESTMWQGQLIIYKRAQPINGCVLQAGDGSGSNRRRNPSFSCR